MSTLTASQNWLPTCTEAVEELLETMFFETLLGPPSLEADPPADAIWVAVNFLGGAVGRMWVALESPLAAGLVSNFLGREDGETAGAGEEGLVACEFANMLCGCMMSRVDPENRLEISPPRLAPWPGNLSECYAFPLDNGRIFVAMEA